MQQLQRTKNNYSQGRTCFFPLCWLFNYIRVGKACIYGALIESEPVQLKCLQANVWSHKAVPLGGLHSSTRLLMTAVCLPWRQGPSARHWHMPGNSNWGKAVCVCVCEACHQDQPSVGIWGYVGEKKIHTRLTPDATFENPSAIFLSNQPADWRSAFTVALTSCLNWLMQVVSTTWGCPLWSSGKRGGWNARKVHRGTALGQTD